MILAVDPADWETEFRKLTYEEAEKYGLEIIDSNTGDIFQLARDGQVVASDGSGVLSGNGSVWTPNGLVIPGPLDNFLFNSYGAFQLLPVEDASAFIKVTTSPDYSDPGVSFVLQRSAKVFLVPRIESIVGEASDGISEVDLFACEWQALQRSFWLDRVFTDSGYEFPILSYPTHPITLDPLELTDADKVDLVNELTGLSGTLADDSATGSHSPTTWPLYNASQHVLIEQTGSSVMPLPEWKEGTLLACVKQEGQVYYFWCSVDGTIVTNSKDIDVTGLV